MALEEGAGVSYCGKRAIVSMKHVGLNVAADPFMNLGVSGVHGGLVIVVADDPGMHSSQNEQDSRCFADFAMVPKVTVELDTKAAHQVLRLIEGLEDLEDVQRVYSNADFSDEAIES